MRSIIEFCSKICFPFRNFLAPKSLKPLKERDYHKLFWNFYIFMGLEPAKLDKFQRIRALATFIICACPTILMIFVSVFTSDDVDDVVHGIQIIPVMLLMIFDVANFVRKMKKIEEFCGKFDLVIARHQDMSFCRSKFQATNLYFISSTLFFIGSMCSNIVVLILTGKSGIPSVKVEDSFGLAVVVLFQFFGILYTGSIFLFMDTFMCSLLFLMSGYAEHLGEKLKTINIKNVKDIVDLHLEFKK